MVRPTSFSPLGSAALSILVTLCISLVVASSGAQQTKEPGLTKRLLPSLGGNNTASQACHALKFSSKDSKIIFPPFAVSATRHYMTSSADTPACTVEPATLEDLSHVIKLVGKRRVAFAVQSGGHSGNPGFSSTKGIQITMSGFKQVKFNSHTKTVDIGTGNLWDDVYDAIKDTGYQIVGGRVSGVGTGGFLFAGGGYSWLTNQRGLTADTLQSFDIVLPDGTIKQGVTAKSDPDLFFALKGGGNQFGVVSNFRLQAFPQSRQVWGGIRTYPADKVDAVMSAVADFSANNKDIKAQMIPTLDYAILGAVEVLIVLAFYDEPEPPAGVFDRFDDIQPLSDGWKTQSFLDLVKSSPSEVASGHRGRFHTVQLQRFSKSILDVIVSEAKFYASQALSHSGYLVSYDIEPFDSGYGNKATDSAWPHKQGGLPLNLYFAWDNPADDQFWHRAFLDTASRIRAQAEKEGQDLSNLLLYPNYCLASTPVKQMYGGNVQRLREIRKRYDPNNVMSLTTAFRF